MNKEQFFSELNDKINALSDGKITVVFFSEFGAVSCLHFTADHSELTGYAQYKNGIAITGRRYRARSLSIWRLYEAKTFAIFRGWLEPKEEAPKSWTCFDRSIFYRIVDSLPKNFMLGEWSERTEDQNTAAPIYKVYSLIEGPEGRRTTYPEVFQTAEQMLEKYTKSGILRDNVCRRALQGAPYIKGFCGPMYDGLDNGRPVIRYESPELYEILSA